MAADQPPIQAGPDSKGPDSLPLPEAEWHALLAGEQAARARFYQRYADPLHRAIRAWGQPISSDDAEELLAEVFVQTFKSIHTISAPEQIERWLFRVARNRVIDFCRSRGRALKEMRLDALSPSARDQVMEAIRTEAPSDPLVKMTQAEDAAALSALVEQVLAELPVRQQQALIEKYQRGKTLEQIATEMKISVEAIAALLHRARGSFRTAFEKRTGT